MWVRRTEMNTLVGDAVAVIAERGRRVSVSRLAIAFAFDAFFTEAQYQIATGRLPYYSGPHRIRTVWGIEDGYGIEECTQCYANASRVEQTGEPCRAFHPRQPMTDPLRDLAELSQDLGLYDAERDEETDR